MLECLQREGREFHSSVLVCNRMYFHGNSTMLGVITSSVQKVSLHTSPDVCVTHGYVFTPNPNPIIYKLHELLSSINIMDGQ